MTRGEIVAFAEGKNILLKPDELVCIARSVVPGCNFLVFGCGNDSPLWAKINKGGRTVFLEHDEDWMLSTLSANPELEVLLVHYDTRVSQWEELLGQDDKLMIQLPDCVTSTKWDVILVDGPTGYSEECIGRMKSIYMASKLVAPGGIILVHDMCRKVEKAYAKRYIGDQYFVESANTLYKYKLPTSSV